MYSSETPITCYMWQNSTAFRPEITITDEPIEMLQYSHLIDFGNGFPDAASQQSVHKTESEHEDGDSGDESLGTDMHAVKYPQSAQKKRPRKMFNVPHKKQDARRLSYLI